MEWIQLWAGITFTAQNGDIEGLLTAAAAGGLHLFDIVPRPGGFSARCAAWHYRKLAALARRRRVRLRIQNCAIRPTTMALKTVITMPVSVRPEEALTAPK